jgi:hypothetical protein
VRWREREGERERERERERRKNNIFTVRKRLVKKVLRMLL